MGYKLEVPASPSSGSSDLLDQLIELRETLTYVCQFIKEYDGQPDEGIRRARSGTILSTGACVPVELGVSPSWYRDAFTNLEALQTLHFGDFMEASSRRYDRS